MRRPHASKLLCLGFDHGAKVVPSVSALLLQVQADAGQFFVADGFGKHGAIGDGANRLLDGVWAQQWIVSQATQGSAA